MMLLVATSGGSVVVCCLLQTTQEDGHEVEVHLPPEVAMDKSGVKLLATSN
jgi:hypothetical protein